MTLKETHDTQKRPNDMLALAASSTRAEDPVHASSEGRGGEHPAAAHDKRAKEPHDTQKRLNEHAAAAHDNRADLMREALQAISRVKICMIRKRNGF